MKKFLNSAARVLVACAMAAFLVPAGALSALAYEGEFFEIDGLTYLYTGAAEGVQLVGADPEVVGAEDGTCTVPATVEFEGKTLPVMSIKHNTTIYNTAPNQASGGGFTNCTKLRDLRIECLTSTANSMYSSAGYSLFLGCDNLEVVHFLGNGGTAEVAAASLGGLKVVLHQGLGTISYTTVGTVGSYTTSESPDVYYSVIFEEADGTQTEVFVSENCTVSMLSGLTENVVYTDAELYGSSALAPNSVAPSISSTSVWVFTTEDGEQLGVNDTISAPGTAVETSIADISGATMYLETEDFTYNAAAGKDPGAYVVDANGQTIDAANYELTYYTEDGAEIALESIVECGTYIVRASGVGAFYGSCEASFTVTFVTSSWTRFVTSVAKTDNVRHYLSSQARLNTSSYSNADGDTISSKAVIVVNPDDYASCAVAVSLAGLFGCGIITADDDCIRTSNGLLNNTNVTSYSNVLSGNLAIVLGSSEYISDALYTAVATTVGDGGKVTRFDTESAASEAAVAEAVYANMLAAAEGEFSLGVEYFAYSNTAMVLPAGGSAAAFAALTYAYAECMPVFFASDDGSVSAATAGYLAAFEEVLAVGFDASAEAALAASAGAITSWGDDEDAYAAALSYSLKAADAGVVDWASSVSLCGASDFGILACTAAVCGFSGSMLLLTGSEASAQSVVVDFVTEHRWEIETGFIFGSYTDVPATLQTTLENLRAEEDANDLAWATVKATTEYAYTGQAITPTCTVTLADGTVATLGDDYVLYYYDSNTTQALYNTVTDYYWASGTNVTAVSIVVGSESKMVEPGEYTVIAKGTFYQHKNTQPSTSGTGLYTGTTGTCTGSIAFTITILPADVSSDSGSGGAADEKASQSIKVKATKATVKAKKLKKKALTCTFKVTGAKTALVATAANAKSKKALKVKASGKKSVKITLKKGTKKGTYKVKVYAKATGSYAKSASKTITINVK